jgi:hypothetical protein
MATFHRKYRSLPELRIENYLNPYDNIHIPCRQLSDRNWTEGMVGMHAHDVEVVEVSNHHAKLPVNLPVPVLHWLREHTVHDLKVLLLEMHTAGEDITDYAPALSELERLEREWKMSGDVPASEEDLNPLEYVEEEINEAFA